MYEIFDYWFRTLWGTLAMELTAMGHEVSVQTETGCT